MFEALLVLFVFGGFWSWTLLAVVSLLLIAALENNCEGWATALFFGTLVALVGLGNGDWVTWVLAHPIQLLAYVAGYLGIGVLYGTAKWWVLVRDAAIRYRRYRDEWIREEVDKRKGGFGHAEFQEAYKTGVMNETVLDAWRELLADSDWYRRQIAKPLARRNKGRITGWMTYWPWSGLWTLINDPVRRFFNWAYANLAGLLQRMADSAFKDIDKEMGDE